MASSDTTSSSSLDDGGYRFDQVLAGSAAKGCFSYSVILLWGLEVDHSIYRNMARNY